MRYTVTTITITPSDTHTLKQTEKSTETRHKQYRKRQETKETKERLSRIRSQSFMCAESKASAPTLATTTTHTHTHNENNTNKKGKSRNSTEKDRRQKKRRKDLVGFEVRASCVQRQSQDNSKLELFTLVERLLQLTLLCKKLCCCRRSCSIQLR